MPTCPSNGVASVPPSKRGETVFRTNEEAEEEKKKKKKKKRNIESDAVSYRERVRWRNRGVRWEKKTKRTDARVEEDFEERRDEKCEGTQPCLITLEPSRVFIDTWTFPLVPYTYRCAPRIRFDPRARAMECPGLREPTAF